jgi:hypothetical protein
MVLVEVSIRILFCSKAENSEVEADSFAGCATKTSNCAARVFVEIRRSAAVRNRILFFIRSSYFVRPF